jgi:ADP-heptose:LPS heptosyltransferase
MTGRTLVARLDSVGDVLLTGPAVRAVAAGSDHVVFLAGPRGRAAADMLPGVDEVIEYEAPWVVFDPRPFAAGEADALIKQIRDLQVDRALIFTSFHQSPLPLALLLRMAGVPWIGAISDDYPGSLLDVRHRITSDMPEAERALSLAAAAGDLLPAGDPGRLDIRRPLPDVSDLVEWSDYVVVHPGAAVPARRMSAARSHRIVMALLAAGYHVVTTGGPDETELAEDIVRGAIGARSLAGSTDLPVLAAILDRASVVVAPNTGPAHLAAAVGTPVVSLFAPVVPAERWAPYGIPLRILGDQQAPCRDSRARICPVEGHPCLESIRPEDVVAAVRDLGFAQTSASHRRGSGT